MKMESRLILLLAAAMFAAYGEDLSAPVRPGGVEGRPFWNRYSVQFLYGLVKFQAMHGGRKIPTHVWKNDCRGNDGANDWTNCGVSAAMGLEALSDATERTR